MYVVFLCLLPRRQHLCLHPPQRPAPVKILESISLPGLSFPHLKDDDGCLRSHRAISNFWGGPSEGEVCLNSPPIRKPLGRTTLLFCLIPPSSLQTTSPNLATDLKVSLKLFGYDLYLPDLPGAGSHSLFPLPPSNNFPTKTTVLFPAAPE